MTKTKTVALLSILALLASLPLTMALAQGAPYLVLGSATLDGEPAMMGTMVVAMAGEEKVGSGEVFDETGHYRLMINRGRAGDTALISLMTGEGEDATEYLAMTDEDVIIGLSGERTFADLMAYSGEPPEPPPTAGPTLTAAQQRAALRGPRGFQGFPGEPGPAGADGTEGAGGPAGPAGIDGSHGADGADGAHGPAGADGPAGPSGADGPAGTDGFNGSTGPAGPAGADGAAGATGFTGETGADGEAGGSGMIAIVAVLIAIVAVAVAGGAFFAGRQNR